MAETLKDLYHRNEVFWMGLSVALLGVLIPETLTLGELNVSSLFVVTGSGLLVTSVFVGIYRLLTSV